ncbi:hypothetical protein N9L48_01635 [Psychrosphaera sp.]|nr:hypothetical protein [Psychrosphaera sp.]
MKNVNKNKLALLTCVIALSLSETAQASSTTFAPSNQEASYNQLSNKVMTTSNERVNKFINKEIDKLNDTMATKVLAKIGYVGSH